MVIQKSRIGKIQFGFFAVHFCDKYHFIQLASFSCSPKMGEHFFWIIRKDAMNSNSL